MKEKIEAFLKNSLILPLGFRNKKKKAVFLSVLIFTFLLANTTFYPPGTRASEIQNRFEPRSNQPSSQYVPSVRGDRLKRGKGVYLNHEGTVSEVQASAYNVELVGMWPYGGCYASAVDTARNMVLVGNGYTLQVLDISTPYSISKISEVNLEGSPQDIVIAGNYAYLVTLSYFKIVDISDLNYPSRRSIDLSWETSTPSHRLFIGLCLCG